MINTTQNWTDKIYKSAEKKMRITVGDTVLTDDDIQGKLEIQETCTNSKDIKIGSCIASKLKFNVTNKGQDIDFENNEITVEVGLNTGEEFEYIPMGIFTVDDIDDKDEHVYKITARDRISKFDVDCSDFLMSVEYPTTLYSLLQQLCTHVGVPLTNTLIVNGDYQVENSFATMHVTGQEILTWIGEVSASFVNVNRDGKLVLRGFTKVENNLTGRDYVNVTASKYTVPKITRVQVGVKEDDLGVVVGDGHITYSIVNNPLLYTKSEEQITPAMENILAELQKVPVYTPVNLYGKGNPAIEAGDIISVTTVKGYYIDVLVMDRKFVYQKSFRDTYESFGTQAVGEKRIVQSNIIQLKGKFNILTRNLDENTLRLGDVERGYSEISQTVNQNIAEISDIHGNISEITQDVSNFKVEINNTVETTKQELIDYTDEQIADIDVDGKLVNYYTKTQTNSQINQAKDAINLSVDTKIDTATSSINTRTDQMLESYSTTDEMNAAIELKGAEIDLSVSEKILGTYYQSIEPTNPKKGEFWYNPGGDFTVDNLNMTVEQMTMTVDSLVFEPSTLKRWNGTIWEDAKSTETTRAIGEINLKAGEMELRVGETEKNLDYVKTNMSEILMTTDSIALRVASTETGLTSVENGVNNVKSSVAEIKLTTDSITAAVNASKLTFDDSFGLTIKNGGFRILGSSNQELLTTTGGHLEMMGYLQTGTGQDSVKIDSTGIYFNTNNMWDTRIKRSGSGLEIWSDGGISFNNLFGQKCSWKVINVDGTFYSFLSGGEYIF